MRFVELLLGIPLVACVAPAPAPCAAPSAPAWLDDVARPVSIYAATERSGDQDTIDLVTYRDATSARHHLELHFTSYPIVPTTLVVDEHSIPRGAAWGRLGRALLAAGLDNNVTVLLRCFGTDPDARC